jgi:hypothetical protein
MERPNWSYHLRGLLSLLRSLRYPVLPLLHPELRQYFEYRLWSARAANLRRYFWRGRRNCPLHFNHPLRLALRSVFSDLQQPNDVRIQPRRRSRKSLSSLPIPAHAQANPPAFPSPHSSTP